MRYLLWRDRLQPPPPRLSFAELTWYLRDREADADRAARDRESAAAVLSSAFAKAAALAARR